MNNIYKFIISIGICQLTGVISAIFTRSSVSSWYRTINKPFFNPPDWVFAPVWITLYFLIGISAYLIWKNGFHSNSVKYAILIFCVQLIFNFLWSISFFGMHSILGGLVIIIMLWILILITFFSFYQISYVSGLLLLPYILWVSFAGILNYFIWKLN